MALIQFPLNDIHVTASTMGEHFAIHPAVLVDENGELWLDGATWFLQHVPSGKQAMALEQEDPIEWPGEPRALDLGRVAVFVAWLEGRLDCSTEPDFASLSDADKMAISLFRTEPNHWTAPTGEEEA